MDIVDQLREQAKILCANGRGGEYLDDAANEIDRLRAALQPFADIGAWFFARPQVPDETPVVDLHFINGVAGALTRGQFKAASSVLVPNAELSGAAKRPLE